MSLALLLTTATATAVGAAALCAAHGLRREVTALRGDLAGVNGGESGASVPQARTGAAEAGPVSVAATTAATTDTAEAIRAAVADALADERERELAEARAFWAAQETRDAADTSSVLGGLMGPGVDPSFEDVAFFMPRQADFSAFESFGHDLPGIPDAAGVHGAPYPAEGASRDPYDPALYDQVADAFDDFAGLPSAAGHDGHEAQDAPADGAGDAAPAGPGDPAGEFPEDSPELAAARRRHPSHPDFTPNRTPIVTDHERTVARLEKLAGARTALSDVRPGPLGTLDVYMFTDGTTLCMTPGHRETAERLARSLREGGAPFLLGGSGVSGAYSLTFSCGASSTDGQDTAEEHVYILADRVIASL
ncbi:hypothetical protein [Streptomyces sp. 8L]|uniref:hypothetical protein n=1 Tax=Streptomyces sp. 8L TaxID=2877242 RepID=UPI001CD35A83|nr:hypothetical protein [Streptomyces sp. 8L]MCA1223973.1 hypothetical protein [Streptomyces sp. 8L]